MNYSLIPVVALIVAVVCRRRDDESLDVGRPAVLLVARRPQGWGDCGDETETGVKNGDKKQTARI